MGKRDSFGSRFLLSCFVGLGCGFWGSEKADPFRYQTGSFSDPEGSLFDVKADPKRGFFGPGWFAGPRGSGCYSDVKEREGILPCVGQDLKVNVRFLELENRKCDGLGVFDLRFKWVISRLAFCRKKAKDQRRV